MSTLDINHDLIKPSIIQENEHTYLIQIPNKPNNIVFRVQTSFEFCPDHRPSQRLNAEGLPLEDGPDAAGGR